MSSQFTEAYRKEVLERLEGISQQDEAIERAAQMLYETECAGGRIYTFGTGHSHMMGQDIYARAGGYAKVYPILEIELTLLTHPTKSTRIERTAEYADVLEELYHLKAGDTVIACSNSGRNALVVEYISRLKKQGVKIIAITSLTHSKTIASRHPSGLRLFELADVVLDNCAPYGDAAVSLSPEVAMGPVSTLTGCYLSQMVMGRFVEKLLADGREAPVFASSNRDGADERNQELMRKYVLKHWSEN